MSYELKQNVMTSQNSAAAIKQGSFEVDSSGQATYRLPIMVPPGINGLSPQLGLNYSHRGGNGPLGIGWSLEGMSSITRVGGNYATDGYKSAINFDTCDRLSLDGKRLVNVDGAYWSSNASYATEIQSWVKIKAGSTDEDGFIAVTKSGEVHEFGKTVDSRILSGESGSPVRIWALNAIQDLDGNRIEFSYTQTPVAGIAASGAFYLQTITYTKRQDGSATGNRFVVFSYTGRTDPIVSYVGGCKIVVACLLDTITTYIDDASQENNLVATYQLNYDTSSATRRSRVNSISVTGAAAEGSSVLPDIRFTWQDVTTPSISCDQADAVLGQGRILSLDVDGDGLTDVVQFHDDESTGELCVDTYLARYSNGKVTFEAQPTSPLKTVYPDSRQLFATDIDGDGRGDLLVVYPDSGNGNSLSIDISLSTGNGFSTPSTVQTANKFSSTDLFFVVDLNGDGRSDLVQATMDTQSQTLLLNCYVSTIDSSDQYFNYTTTIVTNFPFPSSPGCLFAADVNGDGLTDLVLLAEDTATGQTIAYCLITSVAQSNGFTPFNLITVGNLLNIPFAQRGTLLPADPNGDGLTDIVHIFEDSEGSMKFQSYLSDGIGNFIGGAVSEGFTPCSNLFPMGFFGGGATDILGCSIDPASGNWQFDIYSASPAGDFSHTTTVSTGQSLQQMSLLIGDLTGSGKADFIHAYLDENACVNLQPYLSAGPYPDLLNLIEDQIGGQVLIDYQPLTNASVYSAGEPASFPQSTARRYSNRLSPAQFPVQSVIGQAVYVVGSYTFCNAPSRNRYPYSFAFSMTYANAQIDLLGRGWQGFEKVSILDQSSLLLTSKVYNQNFPFTGQVASISTESGGLPLTLALTTYLSQPSAIYPLQNSIEVLATGVLNYSYCNGAFDYVTARLFADLKDGSILHYDAFGNNLREAWYGYVQYIDPAGITSPDLANPSGNPILPGLLTPLESSEILYSYRAFVNNPDTWVLGLPAYEKQSQNPVDVQIDSFNPGDLTLQKTTYYPDTFKRKSVNKWDDGNQSFLTHSYQYDAFGNCIAETHPGNRTYQYTYETAYHTYPDQTISPVNEQGQSLVSYVGYDPRFGTRIAELGANGFIAVTALDGFGRLVAKQGPVPDGIQSDTNLLSGWVTGSMGQRFKAAEVLSLQTCAYQDDGLQGINVQVFTLQEFPRDKARIWTQTLQFVDGLSHERLAAVATGNGQYSAVHTDYNSRGKIVSKSLPDFCKTPAAATALFCTNYQYDALDRPVQEIVPAGSDGQQSVTTEWEYGPSGLVTQTQAPGTTEQLTQSSIYHWFNGKYCIVQTRVDIYGDAVTTYEFDPLARTVRTVDPVGVVNTVSYDSLSRKVNQNDADQSTSSTNPAFSFSYDASTGQLSSQVNTAGERIVYKYDQLGRVLNTTFADGRQFAYQYDTALNRAGRLAMVTISAGTSVESSRCFAYDKYGNVSEETLSIVEEVQPFVTTSVYDPLQRLVTQNLPDQSVLQRSFSNGLLCQQTLDGVEVTYSSFSPAGNYNALDYNNGAAFTYKRNPLDQIYTETLSLDGSAWFSAAYQYDSLQQVTQVQEIQDGASTTQIYGYQGNRLVNATVPGFEPTGYQYDPGGNLQSKNADQYRYDAHFPTQVKREGAVTYQATRDACGRTSTRVSNGRTLNFQYDGLGCLRGVTDNAGASLLLIMSDEQGGRLRQVRADGTVILTINPNYQVTKVGVETTVRKTLVDSNGALAAIITSNSDRQLVYFRRDMKRSVTHYLDAQGTLQNQLCYDGYGQAAAVYGSVPDLPMYESRSWDTVTELYYFGSRYYDPLRGSFLTPDTQLGGRNALQCNVWNRFSFELNNPINHIDSDGHSADFWAGLAIGLLAIAGGAAIILSAGTATGAVAVGLGAAAGALIGGGVAAVGYSLQHTRDFSWKDFGIEVGINVGIGALAGGLMAGIGGAIAKSAAPLVYGAISSSAVGAVAGASSTALTALAQGKSVSWTETGISAAFGFAFGAAGGAITGKIGARLAPELEQVEQGIEMAAQRGGVFQIAENRIVPGNGVNGGMPIRIFAPRFTGPQMVSALRTVAAVSIITDVFLPISESQVSQAVSNS